MFESIRFELFFFFFHMISLKKIISLIIPSLCPTLKEEKEQKFIGRYKICITFIQETWKGSFGAIWVSPSQPIQ